MSFYRLTSLILLALAGLSAQRAQAQYFTDPLTGPTSPNLNLRLDKYEYSPLGLVHFISEAGTYDDNMTSERVTNSTVRSDYLSRDFIYEISIATNPSTQTINYVGFGAGTPNPSYYNEPTNCFLFRIHNWGGYQGIHAAVDRGFSSNPFVFIREIGQYNASGTRVQIMRQGDNVTMSIVGQPASAVTYSIAASGLPLDNGNAYLFFGNGAVSSTFSDMSVSAPAGGPTVTYDWLAGDFGSCQPSNGVCGAGSQTRSVSCMGSDGSSAPASSCSGTAPASSQSCSTQCTGTQLVYLACRPDSAWKNHGAYVSCVAKAVNGLVSQGTLSASAGSALVSAAGQSTIGK